MLKCHGDFPQKLYRVFECFEYAESFRNGLFRFGNILYYKSLTDLKRRDDSEGDGRVITNGISHNSSFCSTSFFLLSFHRSLEAALNNSKMGNYIIEINNCFKIAEGITNKLNEKPENYFGGIEGVNIEYTFGEESDDRLNHIQLAKLTYSQKPESFKNENEYRFVITKKYTQENFIYIDIDTLFDDIQYVSI